MTGPSYFDAMDYPRMLAEFGRPGNFAATVAGISRDELRARQENRFARIMAFGWRVPLYVRQWGSGGSIKAISNHWRTLFIFHLMASPI